jgi:hypothetical protein
MQNGFHVEELMRPILERQRFWQYCFEHSPARERVEYHSVIDRIAMSPETTVWLIRRSVQPEQDHLVGCRASG